MRQKSLTIGKRKTVYRDSLAAVAALAFLSCDWLFFQKITKILRIMMQQKTLKMSFLDSEDDPKLRYWVIREKWRGRMNLVQKIFSWNIFIANTSTRLKTNASVLITFY